MFSTPPNLSYLPASPPRPPRCILRIRADDPEARVPLGLKYGAEMSEGPRLLKVAKDLGLQVSLLTDLSDCFCWIVFVLDVES